MTDPTLPRARVVKVRGDAAVRAQIWRLARSCTIQDPLITIATPTRDALTMYGNVPFAFYLNVRKIPSTCELVRAPSSRHTGVIFHDEDTRRITITYPKGTANVRDAFVQATTDVLREHGASSALSGHRPNSNDIVFEMDGRQKKFCGTLDEPTHRAFAAVITLRFNAHKIDGVYRLDSPKFAQRGKISHISEAVGGLVEVIPDADDTLVDAIVDRTAKLLGWELVVNDFSDSEKLFLTT